MDLRVLTDAILLRLIKADDEKAFREIYIRYWKRIFEKAHHRLGNREVAKELVQGIFLRVWEKRHQHQILHLENYLQTAIRNSIINYIEATLVQNKYLQHISQAAHGVCTYTEAVIHYHELSQAIERAIGQLPEKTQYVFRLSRFQQLSIREIAASMNLSKKTVEYHITRSLKALRISLKDYRDLA